MDGISFRAVTAPTIAELAAVQKRVDRATMWALREVGRKVKREARKNAPVATGELKKSISSSRRLKRHGPGDYSLTVGPRGQRVHLYAAVQEDRDRYMRPAFDTSVAQAEGLHRKAWERAMRK